MNFDFSDDLKSLRTEARKFLKDRSTSKDVRLAMTSHSHFDRKLWNELASLGWLGATIPENYGGAGLGYEALCILAEEIGRACATVPYASTMYLATEAILLAGSPKQKQTWLPKIASGKAVATFALAEGGGNPSPRKIQTTERDGRLSGEKWPIADAATAEIAIVVANGIDNSPALYVVELQQAAVSITELQTLDPTRPQSRLTLSGAKCERLDHMEKGWEPIQRLLDRAAVLMAFEQLGGAEACLTMATAYAKERYAFGRPIGSFQAIKHKLADMYVANELARSNAYWGAWALQTNAPELPLAAASARVSATHAFEFGSRENIQTHGGMGITWECDAHLYLRRSNTLATAIGTAPYWKDRIVSSLETRNS